MASDHHMMGYFPEEIETPQTSRFFSRPDIQAPVLDVRIHQKSLMSDGYIFIAPFHATQPGPYIYDSSGNLIWSGFGAAGAGNAYNFHVCSYRGSDHLCFHAGMQTGFYSKGHGVVMNKQYQVIKTIHAASVGFPSDMHEFRLTDDGETALMTMYQPRQLDLSKYGITSGLGWILESIFQEVNTTSNELLFEWRSLDHVPPESSYHTLNISKDGQSSETAWDYFHINSVDKNRDGDYLISARHTSCIYKVSGRTGSFLWELQGKNPSFEMAGFNFSWQHDARWVSENETTSVISLFDNARESHESVDSLYSSGKVITLNHITNIASLNAEIPSPNTSAGRLSTESQGNMQLLANSNVFFGWGAEAHISEHLSNGTPIWHAVFGQEHNPNSYRAFKAPWVGDPEFTIPAVWSYGRTNLSRTVVYVSWNGATEVEAWNVYAGESSSKSVKLLESQAPKTGFETTIVLDQFYSWVTVEAVGRNGLGFRNSSLQKTFVPGNGILKSCGEMHCLGPDIEKSRNEELTSSSLLGVIERWSLLCLVMIALGVASRHLWTKLDYRKAKGYVKVDDQNTLSLQNRGQEQ